MLKILVDGPFRYIHCQATGHLIITLAMAVNKNGRYTGKFINFDDSNMSPQLTLRSWKIIARKRISGRLITDDPSYL